MLITYKVSDVKRDRVCVRNQWCNKHHNVSPTI